MTLDSCRLAESFSTQASQAVPTPDGFQVCLLLLGRLHLRGHKCSNQFLKSWLSQGLEPSPKHRNGIKVARHLLRSTHRPPGPRVLAKHCAKALACVSSACLAKCGVCCIQQHYRNSNPYTLSQAMEASNRQFVDVSGP